MSDERYEGEPDACDICGDTDAHPLVWMGDSYACSDCYAVPAPQAEPEGVARERTEPPPGYELERHLRYGWDWTRHNGWWPNEQSAVEDSWRDHDALTAPYRERAERAEARFAELRDELGIDHARDESAAGALARRVRKEVATVEAERDEARALLERCEPWLRDNESVLTPAGQGRDDLRDLLAAIAEALK